MATGGGWCSCSPRSAARIASVLPGDVAAAGALERGGHLRPGQPGRRDRVGGLSQQLQCIRRIQVLESLQRGGEVLAQRGTQPLHLPGTLPDHRLMGAGGHLDRLGPGAVTGHRPQLAGVDAHHVRQGVRIALIALGPRRAVPFPVPGHLPRINRVNPIPGRAQRHDPQAPVGLDADHHLGGLGIRLGELADQRVQPGDPGDPFRQPRPGQHPAPLVLQLDVVMISPVIADKQHTSLPRSIHLQSPARQREENTNGLMEQCSRQRRARHPFSGTALLTAGKGTVSAEGWTIRPGSESAHSPAATGPESAVWPTR